MIPYNNLVLPSASPQKVKNNKVHGKYIVLSF